MSLSALTTALSRLRNASRDFVLQMFAFEGMYERKAIYVRHRLPD
jgi:hypothetical protein